MNVLAIVGLLIIGILLLLAELAVIPGFGIAGILGAITLFAGAAAAWYELGPTWGIAVGLLSFVMSGALLYFFPKTRAGKKLVLQERQHDNASQPMRPDLLGREGHTVTPLRPTGRARFGHEEVDVVSDGEYIDQDEAVKVIAIEGVRVVVMRASTS